MELARLVMEHGSGRTVRSRLDRDALEVLIGQGPRLFTVRSRHVLGPLTGTFVFEILDVETHMFSQENNPPRPGPRLTIGAGQARGELYADWIVDSEPATATDLSPLTDVPRDVWTRACAVRLGASVVAAAALGREVRAVHGGVGDVRLPHGHLGHVEALGADTAFAPQLEAVAHAAAAYAMRSYLADQGWSAQIQDQAIDLCPPRSPAPTAGAAVCEESALRETRQLLEDPTVREAVEGMADLVERQQRERPGAWIGGEGLLNPGGVRGTRVAQQVRDRVRHEFSR